MLIPFQELIRKYDIHPTGVLHIGASIGQEINDYYSNGVKRTIWCEANPELHAELKQNLILHPDWYMIPYCISDKDDETAILHISNNEGQSSSILELGTHAVVHPEVHYTKDIEVATMRIDSFFRINNLNIEEYPFVNLDIQGSELLALKGMGELLHKVKYIYCEVNDAHLYQGCPLTHEIQEYLSQFGFTMVEKVMAGSTGWGDAVFFNSNLCNL